MPFISANASIDPMSARRSVRKSDTRSEVIRITLIVNYGSLVHLSNTCDCIVQFLLFRLLSFLDPFLDQMTEFPSPFPQFVFVHFRAANLQNTNGLFLYHVVHLVTDDFLSCRRSAGNEDDQSFKTEAELNEKFIQKEKR